MTYNPKLTQQQIADNLTIKWDLPIKRRTVGDILNQKEFYESDNEGLPSIYLFIKHVLVALSTIKPNQRRFLSKNISIPPIFFIF
jgi:hypothetical protein